MDGMSQECKGRQPLPNDMAFRHMVLGTIRNGKKGKNDYGKNDEYKNRG